MWKNLFVVSNYEQKDIFSYKYDLLTGEYKF